MARPPAPVAVQKTERVNVSVTPRERAAIDVVSRARTCLVSDLWQTMTLPEIVAEYDRIAATVETAQKTERKQAKQQQDRDRFEEAERSEDERRLADAVVAPDVPVPGDY